MYLSVDTSFIVGGSGIGFPHEVRVDEMTKPAS